MTVNWCGFLRAVHAGSAECARIPTAAEPRGARTQLQGGGGSSSH